MWFPVHWNNMLWDTPVLTQKKTTRDIACPIHEFAKSLPSRPNIGDSVLALSQYMLSMMGATSQIISPILVKLFALSSFFTKNNHFVFWQFLFFNFHIFITFVADHSLIPVTWRCTFLAFLPIYTRHAQQTTTCLLTTTNFPHHPQWQPTLFSQNLTPASIYPANLIIISSKILQHCSY